MRLVRLPCARISSVTALESEHGFCVKAVRKPIGCLLPQSVLEFLPGKRMAGQYIRTIYDWSSSQNNNNNAWKQNFNNGNQNNNNKNNTNSVRAVRGFTQKQIGRETFLSRKPALWGNFDTETVLEYKIFGQSPFFGEIYAT